MIYFTSDFHFNHGNIIKEDYSDRPWDSVEEMNEALVENYNNIINENDEVYILGDCAFSDPAEFIDRLNGKKYLIKGNHDKRWLKKLEPHFEWMKDYHILKHNKKHYILCHYAMRTWYNSHYGTFQLHGHSHGTLRPIGRQMDVGVDANDYRPISIDEITERLEQIPVGPADRMTAEHSEKLFELVSKVLEGETDWPSDVGVLAIRSETFGPLCELIEEIKELRYNM